MFAANALADDPAMLPPDALVKQVADDVITPIKQDREIISNRKKLDSLLEVKALPYADFSRMTRLAVGNKNWSGATPEEQQTLTREFRTFLAHTFANVIALYNNQKIVVAPVSLRPGDTDIVVRTTVIDPVDEPTQIDFKMEKTPTGWKFYDVIVDGISTVKIYRSSFADEILQWGIEKVISILQQKNQAASLPAQSR
ncbi:MAG: ABC transporter substrate-binding protein [Gallionellaceae bacterium]|nr:ABC transporter substrate-binding protein [Gallionellaceae bacterium]